MAWSVGKVQSISMGQDPVLPGFTIQQDGRSPSLTIIFDDEATARECAELMESIVDQAFAIRSRD